VPHLMNEDHQPESDDNHHDVRRGIGKHTQATILASLISDDRPGASATFGIASQDLLK
jgi:hypothetical protein